jgi:hypothetical protein
VFESGVDNNGDGNNDWKLFRIPLAEFNNSSSIVGNPDFTKIEKIRLWISTNNLSDPNYTKIAKIELVGNEWEHLGSADNYRIGSISYNGTYIGTNDSLPIRDDITIEVINNEENPEYESPDGVSGEYNEYEGRFTKEQALSLNFSQINNTYGGIASDEAYFINKFTGYGTMSDDKRNSFFAYKNLEMFVNGINESSWDTDNVEYCIRLGREDNYYEIRKFITSNHCLEVEKGRHENKQTGRWSRVKREERLCRSCQVLGDERHLLFQCTEVERNPSHNFTESLCDIWKNENLFELFNNLLKTEYL